MRYTNKAGLPQPLVDALIYSDYDEVGDISVTKLVLPPRIRLLEKRHDDEIVVDVADLIWRLIGSTGHKILERSNTHNHLAEERLVADLHGWRISGKADLLAPDMTLDDYKFPSVWAMKYAKIEWEQQLNLYAWLYRVAVGFYAKRLRIVAPLRDWSKPKAAREQAKDYPQVGAVVREVPLWSPEKQASFASDRVLLHQRCEILPDDELPLCTDAERWYRGEAWAVKKRGNKRALKLFTNFAEANELTLGVRDLIIEHRPGVNVRCLTYCAVKQFCSFGKTLQGQADSDGEAA